ncbi:hypothetical protein [Streptomyces yanii]|uniref:ATP-binding protein n=1 Tax=Streptomyces yanii TaxID=78510 RepID=A0ABV5RLT5_9ACTN
MLCIYGQAGNGKSFAVSASLRELAPTLTRRIQFRARLMGLSAGPDGGLS